MSSDPNLVFPPAAGDQPQGARSSPLPVRRIGYVLKVFPRLSETFVINEIRALEDLGMRLQVFSLHPGEPDVPHGVLRELRSPLRCLEATHPSADEAVRRAGRQLARRLAIPGDRRAQLLPRKYVRLAVTLAGLVKQWKIGHLHAHFASRAGHVTALAAALARCSYSITAHAKDIYHRDADREVLRWKLAGARFVVTVSDYNRRYLQELVADLPGVAGRVVRLYNGIDLTRFRAAAYPLSSPPRIVAVGRLVEKKGFRVLVEACRMLRARGYAFTCEIIGGGPEEAALRRQIAAADLHETVLLKGVLATEAVAERLREAAVVTLPCVVGADGNVDALPTALLEAMATARPVVSTRLSGIPEIVADGVTGALVTPGDPVALAHALGAMLDDPARAAAMGRAGRERAERLFDLRANAAALRRLLIARHMIGAAP